MKNLSAFINYRYLMAIVPAFLLTSIAFNQETSKQSRSEYPIGQIFKKDYKKNKEDISVSACDIADRCQDITDAQTIGPTITNPDCGEFTIFSKEGCLDQATAEPHLTNCSFSTNPTVWFRVIVDTHAVQLNTILYTNGSWQPVWAIYYGDDCDNLFITNSGTIADPQPCSNDHSNSSSHSVGLIKGVTTYYIAVSGKGIINDPNFHISLYSSAACVSCIGGYLGCNTTADFTIASRSSGRALDDPFFCQGEQVTVCVNYLYDASDTGVDWFHGLIPDFGPGWDMSAFNPDSVNFSPGVPEWKGENEGVCAPVITEKMPLLCTYKDPVTGRLRICNIACQSCPCTPPLLAGAPLPSGWFWSTNGGAGCQNDCSPSSRYGIGSVVVTINFCVDLKVREFETEQECYANRSLQFNFQTTSDGVTGCWQDPVAECKLDKAQIGPNWQIDCERPPKVIGEDAELTHEGRLDIDLVNEDGVSLDIIVTAIPNANVSGAMNHVFPGGSGTIDDYLVSNSTNIEIQHYEAYVNDSSIHCPFRKDTISVVIYPPVKDICSSAIPVCDKVKMTYQLPAVPKENFSGSCVSGQDSLLTNSLFFTWDIVHDGTLEFHVTPAILTDLNFAVFRSDSGDSCKILTLLRCSRAGQTIIDTAQNPLAVYYNCVSADGSVGLLNGETDNFEDPGCTSGSNGFCAPLECKTGEKYYLLVNAPAIVDSMQFTLGFCGTARLSCDSTLCQNPCVKPGFVIEQFPGFHCGSDTIDLQAVASDSLSWTTSGDGLIIQKSANHIRYVPGTSDKNSPISELVFYIENLSTDSCDHKFDSMIIHLVNPTIVRSDSLHVFPENLTLGQMDTIPGSFIWFHNGGIIDNTSSVVVDPGGGAYYAKVTFRNKTCSSEEYLWNGTDQPNDLTGLKIYPNPATDLIHVGYHEIKPENLTLRIFDLCGKQIECFNQRILTQTIELDIRNLATGLYILEISNSTQKTKRKLIALN